MHLPEFISVDNVSKTYIVSEPVIANISMVASKGELICLYGPNGCGKTTFLKILIGIDKSFDGIVRINDKSPEHAHVGLVPQDIDVAFLPWRNVLDNIGLPLELGKSRRSEIRETVRDFVETAGINLPLSMFPYRLSGGQKKLAIILQALISQPELLILDEPFASLDYENTLLVEKAILKLWQITATTTIFVTHDLLTAVCLSDRVILLSPRPMKVIFSQEISLPHPRSRHDPILISILNKLQKIYLTGGEQ